MAEDISCGPEIDVPENNDNSKLQLEADAFLNAIAGGADEDQADEAAFFAANPDGIVVDITARFWNPAQIPRLRKAKKSNLSTMTKQHASKKSPLKQKTLQQSRLIRQT